MHEVSIMEEAVRLAVDTAKAKGAGRVSGLRLRVGAMSGVVPGDGNDFVAGDVDPQQVLRLAQRYYGRISARPVPPRKPRFDPGELARGWHVQYEGLEPGRPLLPDDATALVGALPFVLVPSLLQWVTNTRLGVPIPNHSRAMGRSAMAGSGFSVAVSSPSRSAPS